MIREERTVFLTILTFVIYGLLQVFDKGAFLFPFPLNEPAIFLVFLYISYLNKHQLNRMYGVFGLICLFKLLSQQFFWTIFLPQENLQLLYNGIWIEVFYLLYASFYIYFVFLYTTMLERKSLYLSRIIIIILFLIGIILSQPIVELISFIILFAFSWKYSLNRIFKSLIGLVIVLETGKFLMLLY